MDSVGLPDEYRLIAEQDLVSVIVVQGGLVKYYNHATLELSGYTPDDVRSWKPDQFLDVLIHPDDRAMVAEQARKKQSGDTSGIVPRYRFRLITKEGRAIWVEIFSKTGMYGGAPADILVLIDVTEKHDLEEKLRESEGVFRTISEQSSLGIVIIQDDRVAYVNAKFADIIEVPIDRLLVSSMREITRADGGMGHNAAMAEMRRQSTLTSGTESEFSIKATSRSGKAKTLQMFSKQITLSGRPATLITALDVTAKAELECVLAEEEKKFRIIAEQSSLGIAIVQEDKIAYINGVCAGMLEATPVDLIGRPFEPFMSMIQEGAREDRINKYKQWLAGAHIKENRYVLPFHLPSGRRIAMEVYSKSIEYGGHPAILVTVLDVTARFNAEQELKESEEKFHFIAEKSLIGIIFLQGGKIRYVNGHAASLYGYTTAEMLGWNEQHLSMKVHPGDRGLTTSSFLDHLNKGEVQEAAFRIITRDGTVRWVQTTTGAMSYRGEEAVLLVISDVTAAKEAEMRLKESEEKYRQVFEESAAAIILLSMKGVLIDCNSAAEDIFALERALIVGRPLRDFFPHIVVDPSSVQGALKHLAKNKPVEPAEFEVTAKDGSSIWVRVQAARVKYGSTNVIQVVVNDITEKKKLERILEEENVKLKHLDTIRKNFIFTATHELKTPLVSLYGASEFLLQVLPRDLDDKIKTMIDIIHRGAERLKALVDNLLDVSRMDTGNFKLNLEGVNLAGLVKTTVSNLEYLVSTAGDEIVLRLEDPLIVNADKLRMEQVFTNLLSNAIKNTPRGGKIELILDKVDDLARFSIKDNGVGLSQDEMGELFKQFGKLERTDLNVPVNIQGSGLGLYITRNIIELHGGKIWAESAGRNKGAAFTFTVPLDSGGKPGP